MNRREAIARVGAALAAGAAFAVPGIVRADEEEKPRMKRPRLAAVVTEYRENSHADVIVTKLLEGCKTPDFTYQPRVEMASLYLDQPATSALGKEIAARHGVPIYPTIAEAVTLGGADLMVDGVVLIGEHGHYPYNELGQHLYPRRRFFEETVAVIRRAGRPIPLFNDKHLAYSWADAKWMYDTARELKLPFMAGSSVPVAERRPDLRPAPGTAFTEAVAVGYGATEAYGFHALEGLQCLLEARRDGETGVKRVRCLTGEAVWQAAEAEEWSWSLLQAALACSEKPETAAASRAEIRARSLEPEAFLIEYADGVKGAVLLLRGLVEEFLFAGRVEDRARPMATLFRLQDGKPFSHFARLCAAMEPMFLGQSPTIPIERTLLTTGILDRAMQSRQRNGTVLETPELAIRYGVAEK